MRSGYIGDMTISRTAAPPDIPPTRDGQTPEEVLYDSGTVTESAVARVLNVQRFVQPDDVTCGPTCLRKVYDFYGLEVALDEITGVLQRNEDGGTLAVFLGIAALERGFRARLYSYDLQIFDPTWHVHDSAVLMAKVRARHEHLRDEKRQVAAEAYVRYLELGGELAFDELSPALLKAIIDRGHPVLAGLSATYLYRFSRERWDAELERLVDDDVTGDPVGHFVVISGYDHWGRSLVVMDPSEHVPASDGGRVTVDSTRLINAVMLGDATYDAVLLELWLDGEETTE
jgi:hypothetical protein